jgi:hypothetical protein
MKRWYKEVWENGNFDVIEGYFLPDAHNNYIAPNFGIEPSEIREWMIVLRKFVYDIKVNAIQSIEDGDWISMMLEIHAKTVSNDKPVMVYQQIMLRFEGDKKAESYPAFDFLRFFEQLGQLPEHTHALLLSGTKLK